VSKLLNTCIDWYAHGYKRPGGFHQESFSLPPTELGAQSEPGRRVDELAVFIQIRRRFHGSLCLINDFNPMSNNAALKQSRRALCRTVFVVPISNSNGWRRTRM